MKAGILIGHKVVPGDPSVLPSICGSVRHLIVLTGVTKRIPSADATSPPPHICASGSVCLKINQSGISAGDSFSPQIVRFCPVHRCRVSAGTFDTDQWFQTDIAGFSHQHGADADGQDHQSGTGFTSMKNSSAIRYGR